MGFVAKLSPYAALGTMPMLQTVRIKVESGLLSWMVMTLPSAVMLSMRERSVPLGFA